MKVFDKNFRTIFQTIMFYKFYILAFAIVVFYSSLSGQEVARKAIVCDLPGSAKETDRWVEKDVFYLIAKDERDEFLNLKTVEEKENFIEVFWRKRDPTPVTEANEFKEIYYERIAFANEHFASGLSGWKTDRGIVYILYGKPDKIEKSRSNFEGLHNVLFEKWTYENLPEKKPKTQFIFLDPTESDEFRFENTKRQKLIKTLMKDFRNYLN
jgi:GWxTD domain-containing protein